MGKVLIIDDDKMFGQTLAAVVKQMGHDAVIAFNMKEGLDTARSDAFDVVLLDVGLPDGNGLCLLPQLKELPSDPEVIIITGSGDPDGAELAIKTGAWDYIEKTGTAQKMMLPLVRAMKYREDKAAQTAVTVALKRNGIIGDSPLMKACLDLLAQASSCMANVLITGETGTGKELFAHAIHENSLQCGNRFVVVDCAALPENLVESALFGHVKGAFTGAVRDREGLIKQADGGAPFLDEVGELSLSIQKRFLRVLQERRFRSVGGKQVLKSDFRLISATNRDLDERVRQGRFRSDLFFRLNTLTIKLPPLREYPEDIKEMASFYIAKFCERYQGGIKGISDDFLDKLFAYTWPGNVRELINTLEKSLAAAQSDHTLFPIHLPTHIRIHSARISIRKKTPDPAELNKGRNGLSDFRTAMDQAEKRYLQEVIYLTKGDIKASCAVSGLSRSRLYGLLKKHHISRKT